MVLEYGKRHKTGNYDSFDDLVLIRKKSHGKFLEKRKQFLIRKEAKFEKNKLTEGEKLIKKSNQEELQKKRNEKLAIARKIAEEKEEKVRYDEFGRVVTLRSVDKGITSIILSFLSFYGSVGLKNTLPLS